MDANIQLFPIQPNYFITFFSKSFLAFIWNLQFNPLTFVFNKTTNQYETVLCYRRVLVETLQIIYSIIKK